MEHEKTIGAMTCCGRSARHFAMKYALQKGTQEGPTRIVSVDAVRRQWRQRKGSADGAERIAHLEQYRPLARSRRTSPRSLGNELTAERVP